MYKAIKVKLKPNIEQQQLLAQCFGSVRWFWNYSLNLCNDAYKETGQGLSRSRIQALLPKLKKHDETCWLKIPHSQCLQVVAMNLDTAFKNFFAGRAGKPSFKSKHDKQSLSFPQSVKVLEGDYVKIPKLGAMKANLPSWLDETFKFSMVTISKNRVGRYYISFLYEIEDLEPSSAGKAIGIDLGLTHFLITSEGEKIENPRFTEKHQRNLKVKQQRLSRKKKDSKNRVKARLKVAKVHNKITNSRVDFLHKLSRKIVDDNQVICVENLNIKGMVKNRKLSLAIHQVGWGMFGTMLSYKAKELGKVYQEIDRFFPSSKTCSNCGHKVESLPLDIRSWKCESCHITHDRDINAAIMIRNEGLRLLGHELPISLSPDCKTDFVPVQLQLVFG
jgi:putative transposase